MTVEELFRRIIRAHLGLIVLCMLVPLAVVGALDARRPPTWSGSLRIQVMSQAPGSTTEADALSSRVLALATTPQLVAKALAAAHLQRDPAEVGQHRVSTIRLGSAPIVELQVVDPSRRGAGRLVTALADQVARFMNDANTQHTQRLLADLDKQVAQTTEQQSQLIDALTGTVGKRNRATAMLRIQMVGRNLSQLLSQRNTLRLDAAQRDPVVVVDARHPAVTMTPSSLPAQLALGLVLGLLLGVIVAVVIETLRPRLAGPRALARRLDVPVLGSADMDPEALTNAVSLAARRQGVETVVVMGVDGADDESAAGLLHGLQVQARKRTGRGSVTVSGMVPAPRRGEDPTGGLDPDRAGAQGVRLASLASVGPTDEHTAGVLVVSPASPRAHRVEALEDVLKAMRWPVVGIVLTATRRRWGWGR